MAQGYRHRQGGEYRWPEPPEQGWHEWHRVSLWDGGHKKSLLKRRLGRGLKRVGFIHLGTVAETYQPFSSLLAGCLSGINLAEMLLDRFPELR